MAYTPFLISHFCLNSLNSHKALFGHPINPIFHFWHSNSLFHFPYYLSFISHYHLSYHLTLRSSFYKFPHFSLSLGFISRFNQFLNLAYNFQSYALFQFTFYNLSIHQISRKNPSLDQFIPRIYNKIFIKILGYFWGVTENEWMVLVHFVVFLY